MTTTINHNLEDHMLVISRLYPESLYTQAPSQQVTGEPKPRRRRKKNRGDGGGSGARKRKLSPEQVNFLELNFGNEHKLESERKDKLASELGLDPRQVAVWFQNRRARWKTKKLEEEYKKLKTVHESTVLEKCQLEAQLLDIQEQLSEAKKEIQRLTERVDGASSGCPSSSLSVESAGAFFPEFGMDVYENIFYNYSQGLDPWIDLCNNY